ncbi:hypothetical protein Bca52824_053446 [Brassica carinata]|uniref:Uncharacterized protein n=1 Tax=Brassica carinata TaxID=52824 RepID=A0A8X7ULQ8_BRACI|nr:hypothetical protein Bca52824_053446 [Brassica carinata]
MIYWFFFLSSVSNSLIEYHTKDQGKRKIWLSRCRQHIFLSFFSLRSHSSSVYLEIKLTEEVPRDKQSCFFFRKQVRLQETLTPKKSLILALQEAERNGNSIYIICLIRVEDSEDEDPTSQTFPLSRRYVIHVPSIYYASLWWLSIDAHCRFQLNHFGLLQKRGSSQWNSIMSERSSIVPSSVFTVSSFNSGHSTLGQLASSYMPVKFKFLRARACTRTSPLNLAIEILKWILIKFFSNQCIHIKNKSNVNSHHYLE